MSEPTPSETCTDETSHSEDGLPITSQDQGRGDDIVNMETPSASPSPPPDSIQDGPGGGSNGFGTWPSDDVEDLHEREPVVSDMRLVHVPRPACHRLSQYADAEIDQARQSGSQPPPPPPNVFERPGIASGIAYLNREWVQLSGTPLSSPRRPPQRKYHMPRRRAASIPTSDDEVDVTVKPPKTHNPFDSVDSSEDDSREFRNRSSSRSARKSKSTSRRSRPESTESDLSSSTSTTGSRNPSSQFFPELKKRKPGGVGGESSAAAEWERQKRELKEKNKALDQLMAMEGLEEVKREFLRVKATIEEARKRKGWLKRQDLNLVLMGNAGTGKRTIAALYRDFLFRCDVWPALEGRKVYFKKETGLNLETSKDIVNLASVLGRYSSGTFLLIDAVEHTEQDIRAFLLDVLEQHAEKTVVVLTGSVKGTTSLLGSKPHGRWQFRRRLELKDYDDEQLRRILLGLVHHNSLTIDGGDENPCTLIAAKRVGRGRDVAGFGNVHDLALSFQKMLDRQSLRLRKERMEALDDKCGNTGERSRERADVESKGKEGDGKHEDSMPNPNDMETMPSEEDDNQTEEKSLAPKNEDTDRKRENLNHKPDTSNKAANSDDERQIETKDPRQDLLTMEDIIGPEPADIRTQSAAWKELEKMVGLEVVKKAIGELLVRAKANYRREIRGQEPLKTTLNRVFLGPPGTGKTTVAKLYGQILADIGVLTSQEVVFKTPADFIGQYIGQSEMRTSEILDSTLGKVLIIDDAHMFYNGSRAGATSESDDYRLGCIDVLISRIHNRPGEDRCVILIGYPDMMEEMFQKVNPGLRRRFPLEEAFRFDDYDDGRLGEILRLKMAKEDIKAEQPAMDVAAEVLRRARDRPNFGNGGDVENLLSQAKTRFRERKLKEKKERNTEKHRTEARDTGQQFTQQSAEAGAGTEEDDLLDDDGTADVVLERADFDPEWNRGASASERCKELFEGLIGFEGIIDKFQGFQKTAANMRLNNKDPRESIPFTYVFKGPPGTGKTHTARILGQIFYDIGFLSTNEVIECSASHLIGQFMGQTAPKVINLFERALGKVLFIDEAYRLGGGGVRGGFRGSYEDEAIGELVDCMTKPRFHKKMIVVLAGYDKDMDALMKINAGLQGRFATEIVFPPMSARRCREHLFNLILKEDIEVYDDEPATKEMKEKVLRLFDKLGMTAGWANGRDVKTLAASITERVYKTANELIEEAAAAEGQRCETDTANRKEMENNEGAKQAKFRISTKDLIEFLKDLLRQRIRGGRAK
ncbi:putative nfx1-type zinc finger-containing protein 1 protein [Rosellinia necatrix]|uniref:Putative nfx1-type zinc finger-containing protein 1 protein n=1 Tax=Rosellinia necatrix TaxID=77044 RepID=A0A1W2TPC3_ROSNE|nr:putative nfx1-type zinc finger-containing protein 1 protein [Rosellinia necatrix]